MLALRFAGFALHTGLAMLASAKLRNTLASCYHVTRAFGSLILVDRGAHKLSWFRQVEGGLFHFLFTHYRPLHVETAGTHACF